MQLTLSMDAGMIECKLVDSLSTQLYKWCISEEDTDSTRLSIDELLLEASEAFKMSQTMSPDSCALFPTAPSSVDLLTTRTSSTQLESVI